MANPKDETGRGQPRPADAATGKRPHATLDLHATEIGGDKVQDGRAQDGPAQEGKPADAEPGPATHQAFADRLRGAGAGAAAWAAGLRSKSAVSHLGAGAVGGLVALAGGYLLLPAATSPDQERAAPVAQLAKRIADAEAAIGLGSGNTGGLRARLDGLSGSVRELGEAQAQASRDLKALDARIGSGAELPRDLAQRLARLEEGAARPPGASGEATKAAMAAVDSELAAARTEAARLGQRIDALRTDVEDRMRGVVRSAELAPVQARLALLDKDIQALQRTEADSRANSSRVLLSLELAALKRAMDRGQPFATELAAVRNAADGTLDLKPLERYMREGVRTQAEIAGSFRKVSNAMVAAESDQENASFVDRLLSGARSIVSIRKAGHSETDTSLEAIIGRMDSALKEGTLGAVLAQGRTLPPKAALAAEDWLQQVEARAAVDQAMAAIETGLKSSLAGTGRTGAEAGR